MAKRDDDIAALEASHKTMVSHRRDLALKIAAQVHVPDGMWERLAFTHQCTEALGAALSDMRQGAANA